MYGRPTVVSFEPNLAVAPKLHARIDELRAALPGTTLRVVNDTAVSVREGVSPFGIDSGAYDGRASSLMLSRTAPLKAPDATKPKELGKVVEVGSQQKVSVRTLDFVHYLRALRVPVVSLWLDAEGAEFEILRDLLTSGVLCARVDNLWMDWHPSRFDWRKEKLPTSEVEMHKVYKWMLESMDNRVKHQTGTADPDTHCKTVMFTVGQR